MEPQRPHDFYIQYNPHTNGGCSAQMILLKNPSQKSAPITQYKKPQNLI